MSTKLQKIEDDTLTLSIESEGWWLWLNEDSRILDKEMYFSLNYLDKITPSLKEKHPDIFQELERMISDEETISLSDLILRVGHLCAVSASVGNKFISAFERPRED